ncbi:OmpW family outer membrane protein [Uliginosibacterium sp. 31-16]|uniref:OmpW/AlkL family protein n=1 Tax=Uliginosibacterium sp. 31-16 TaxID=3068315 RepID=UPI00273EA50B|nr:OmpW family outer membrane protein [Uliginosibacterium sp. 31-16]MDP5238328.1 OmpW family outer membrane protein [Uliginosibacterium sp. 31-16]
MNKTMLAAVLAMAAAFSTSSAFAQESPWQVRARAVFVDFDNAQSEGLPLGGSVRVEAASRWIPEVDISYFFTKNIATELVLTYPQGIDIEVGGTKQGRIRALPPSLLLQYHATDLGAFKPYVGLGLNYTIFSKRSNILDGAAQVERSSFGPAFQIGMDYMLDKHWSINLDLKYIRMDTDVTVGGDKVGKVGLNPVTAGLGFGYRF